MLCFVRARRPVPLGMNLPVNMIFARVQFNLIGYGSIAVAGGLFILTYLPHCFNLKSRYAGSPRTQLQDRG